MCGFRHGEPGVFPFCTGSLEQQIENLWQVELGDSGENAMSPLDQKVVDLWERESILEGGHYTIPIPWKRDRPCLPNNQCVARHRLHSLQKRLESKGLTEKYGEGINKFLDKGYAERVPENELDLDDGTVWYLPHHPVISEAKGGKLRVVIDCSAKLRRISLNNQCLRGPDLTNKLLDVLVRFRQHEYAIMADVESMYMQVRIPLKDRNAFKISLVRQNREYLPLQNDSTPFRGCLV